MSNTSVIWIAFLHEAAKRNLIGKIDAALAEGVAVDALDGLGATALVRAVEQAHEEATRHLLSLGAVPTAPVWREALNHKHYTIIDLLLESGSDLPDDLCHVLSRDGKWARSAHCPPLNPTNWYQNDTADILSSILLYSGSDMYLYLLHHPLLQQKGLLTPCVLDSGLLCASYMGITDTLKPLLDMGADVNAARHDGQTALHFAVNAGHLPAVETLLQQGANINRAASDGSTPLITAVSHNCRRIASFLLKHGADVRPKLNRGDDAESIAANQKMDKVLREIRARK